MAQNTRAKNQEMAKRLKEMGDERTTARCAVCYRIISLNHLGNHYLTNCGSK